MGLSQTSIQYPFWFTSSLVVLLRQRNVLQTGLLRQLSMTALLSNIFSRMSAKIRYCYPDDIPSKLNYRVRTIKCRTILPKVIFKFAHVIHTSEKGKARDAFRWNCKHDESRVWVSPRIVSPPWWMAGQWHHLRVHTRSVQAGIGSLVTHICPPVTRLGH